MWPVYCVLSVWGKIMIPICRLWLYDVYGHWCPKKAVKGPSLFPTAYVYVVGYPTPPSRTSHPAPTLLHDQMILCVCVCVSLPGGVIMRCFHNLCYTALTKDHAIGPTWSWHQIQIHIPASDSRMWGQPQIRCSLIFASCGPNKSWNEFRFLKIM